MHDYPTICLLLKAPLLGRVKSRLAAGLGPEEALQIYRRLAVHQLKALPPEWKTEVHFSPPAAESLMRAWLEPYRKVEFFVQPEGDLGVRLIAAQAGAFRRGAHRVMLIGGDCPELDRAKLKEAATALRDHDVVIAPASDGGYALLGMKQPQPALFEEITWSTAQVLNQTLQRVTKAKLSIATMRRVSDVDDASDWQRLKHLLEEEDRQQPKVET